MSEELSAMEIAAGVEAPAKAEVAEEVKEETVTKETSSEEVTEEAVTEESAEEATTEEAPAEETAKDAEEDWGEPTGDEVTDSVLSTLQDSGISVEDAKALLFDAVQAGDPSKIDRDALVEKVGKAKATLIMAGVENVTARNNARIAEVTKLANEAAGSQDNWNKATEWARENVAEGDLNELRSMIDKGGMVAKMAVNQLVSLYNADPKNTSLNAKKSATNSVATAPAAKAPAIEGISRREYGDRMAIMHRRGAGEAEFAALRAARQAGIKAGK